MESESVDHLFLHCGVVASLPCLVRCPWCFFGSLVGLIEAWRLVPIFGCGAFLWQLIPFSILWYGKGRNGMIFRGSHRLFKMASSGCISK